MVKRFLVTRFFNDQWLIRAKDWILLVIAIAGIVSWGVTKFYASPLMMDMRLKNVEDNVKEFNEKTLPRMDLNDRRITILETKFDDQNRALMLELQSINRKLER